MKQNLTYGELINEADKKGKANGAILTRMEVEEPWLKIYWVKLSRIPEEEIEYDETGKKKRFTKIKDLTANYPELETFGGKLCLCEYMQDYRDKIPYYNDEYKKNFGVPLYDNSGELIQVWRKSHKVI